MPKSGTVRGCNSGQERFKVFSASKGPNIPLVLLDFGDRWPASKVPLRAITYQKLSSRLRGVQMVRGKTCAKHAFSPMRMHKVGSAPMAISRQRSGISSNGQKWRMRDSSEYKDQDKSRHRFWGLFQRWSRAGSPVPDIGP